MKKLLGMAVAFGLLVLMQPYVARAASDDGGLFPDNKDNAKCETHVAKDVGNLVACYIGCHIKAANKSLASVKKVPCNDGHCFDEEACEVKCDTVYNTKIAKLEALVDSKTSQPICPPCLDPAALGMLATGQVESANGANFCEGSANFPFAP